MGFCGVFSLGRYHQTAAGLEQGQHPVTVCRDDICVSVCVGLHKCFWTCCLRVKSVCVTVSAACMRASFFSSSSVPAGERAVRSRCEQTTAAKRSCTQLCRSLSQAAAAAPTAKSSLGRQSSHCCEEPQLQLCCRMMMMMMIQQR